MSEIFEKNIDLYPQDSLYGQLRQLRASAEDKEGIPPHIAITKELDLADGLSFKVCLGARDSGSTQEDSMFIRIGDDLSNPVKHDWIAASEGGAVSRYDHRMKGFSPIEDPDEIEMIKLLVEEINRQYSDIHA